jgi:hypothetical protein
MRVLLQSKTPLVLEAAEVPKNFLEAGLWTKYLWHRDQIQGGDIKGWDSRRTMVGLSSGRHFKRRNSTTVVCSGDLSSVTWRLALV